MSLPPYDRQCLKEVFAAARALPAADRQAYLSAACAGNEAPRQEVESLLASDARAKSFLESPAVVRGDGTSHTAQFTIEGRRLGAYQVQALLGAGGMGQVYRARDTELNRDVALKLLPDVVASDPDRLARLTREARTLASLNHPHIAAIYGIEESEGIRALVMELVEGEDLVTPWGRSYDVAKDGRFLLTVNKERDTSPAPAQMIFVQHWFEKLKRLVPTK